MIYCDISHNGFFGHLSFSINLKWLAELQRHNSRFFFYSVTFTGPDLALSSCFHTLDIFFWHNFEVSWRIKSQCQQLLASIDPGQCLESLHYCGPKSLVSCQNTVRFYTFSTHQPLAWTWHIILTDWWKYKPGCNRKTSKWHIFDCGGQWEMHFAGKKI